MSLVNRHRDHAYPLSVWSANIGSMPTSKTCSLFHLFSPPNPTRSAEMHRQESSVRDGELNQGETLSAEAVCYLW
jgi:hypothetical protein